MRNTCQKCGRIMRSDRKKTLCKECSQTCECGKAKDFRALLCKSCSMRATAIEQWKISDSAIRNGLRDGGIKRRWTIDTIPDDVKWQTKLLDGRRWTWYWDGGKKRAIYRYQLNWIRANGPIPKGYHVHHINEDHTDDRLENLALLTAGDHSRLHMLSGRAQKMVAARRAKAK